MVSDIFVQFVPIFNRSLMLQSNLERSEVLSYWYYNFHKPSFRLYCTILEILWRHLICYIIILAFCPKNVLPYYVALYLNT